MTPYLDLLSRTLTAWPYLRWEEQYLRRNPEEKPSWQKKRLSGPRLHGLDWPVFAHTMVGRKRLDHLAELCVTVLRTPIPGDFVDAGTWRGGCAIMMSGALEEVGQDRRIFVCDSFQGLPKPDPKFPEDMNDKHHEQAYLSVPMWEVEENFRSYDLLTEAVVFVPGFFEDSLPELKETAEEIALLRIDADMFGSTWTVLENLYDRVVSGGFVIVDDYNLKGCRDAVNQFRIENDVTEELQAIDGQAVYWRVR